MISPEVILLLRIIFAILGFLLFQINLKIVLCISVKDCVESLIKISFNLQNAFDNMYMFNFINLTNHWAWKILSPSFIFDNPFLLSLKLCILPIIHLHFQLPQIFHIVWCDCEKCFCLLFLTLSFVSRETTNIYELICTQRHCWN